MKRPGFTILETLIAFGVLLLAYSGLVMYNRSLSNITIKTEDSAQAASLAEVGIDQIRMFQSVGQASGLKLSDVLGLTDNNLHQRYLNYNSYQFLPGEQPILAPNKPKTTYADLTDHKSILDPTTSWCDGVAVPCQQAFSTVHPCPDAAPGGVYKECIGLNSIANLNMQNTWLNNTEVNYWPVQNGALVSVSNAQKFDFYYRQINVQRVPDALSCGVCLGGVSALGGGYQVTVIVENPVTGFSLTRETFLYD